VRQTAALAERIHVVQGASLPQQQSLHTHRLDCQAGAPLSASSVPSMPTSWNHHRDEKWVLLA
jgi:hypothetical protein